MISVILFTVAAVVLFFLLIFSTHKLRIQGSAEQLLRELCRGPLPARNHRDFPVVLQAVSDNDHEFLKARVSAKLRARAIRARRAFALEYLQRLRNDYHALHKIARLLAIVAARTGTNEFERVKYALTFECLWTLVWLKIRFGAQPVHQMRVLADQLGALASTLDSAVASWQEASITPKSNAFSV
jgi:hypothetical protein